MNQQITAVIAEAGAHDAGAMRQFQFHECTDLRAYVKRIDVWKIDTAMR
jgi:hypothetical protein